MESVPTLPETWRTVECAPEYSVSNLGRVMSFKRRRPKILNGWVDTKGYRRVAIDGKTMSLGRLVAMAFLPNPEGLAEVDHVDRDPLNNHVDNIRWASRSLNCINRRTWGDCCYRGVTYHRRACKFHAQIRHHGVHTSLGYYETPEEAASVFDFHAKELRGADAHLNFG